jgi:hypothetical protein
MGSEECAAQIVGNTVQARKEELARLRRELARVTAERTFKASGHALREGPGVKYRAIRDNAGRLAVNLMRSAVQVSTSGYYGWRDHPPAAVRNRTRNF